MRWACACPIYMYVSRACGCQLRSSSSLSLSPYRSIGPHASTGWVGGWVWCSSLHSIYSCSSSLRLRGNVSLSTHFFFWSKMPALSRPVTNRLVLATEEDFSGAVLWPPQNHVVGGAASASGAVQWRRGGRTWSRCDLVFKCGAFRCIVRCS